MKKSRRVLAFLLVLILTVQPMSVWAEDLFSDGTSAYGGEDIAAGETSAYSGEDIAQGEITDVSEEGSSGTEEEIFTSGEETELFTDQDISGSSAEGSGGEIIEEIYVEEELASPLIVTLEDSGYGISLFSLETYEGSYGNQLEGTAREVYDACVEKWVTNYSTSDGSEFIYELSTPITFPATLTQTEAGKNTIAQDDNYNAAIAEIRVSMQAVLDAFSYDHPEVFWMRGNSYSYGISVSGSSIAGYTGKISSLTITPKVTYEGDITSLMTTFMNAVNSAVSTLAASTEGDSTYDKVKAVHDYVCSKAYYNSTDTTLKVHCAGPFFVGDGGVVCEGYAKAMKILCDRLGIDCACISGSAKSTSNGSGEAHMWNYIKMDNGKWYLVDATWDDQDTKIWDNYLLAGSSSSGFYITIGEERTEKNTFSSPDNFTPMSFVYPALSKNSYLSDQGCSHSWTEVSTVAEATCTTAAVKRYQCELCQGLKEEEEGSPLGHSLIHKEASAATCVAAGNIEYWHCSACDKYFSDESGTVEITQAETVIAAGHSLTAVKAKEATCTEAGNIAYWHCSACDKYFSDAAGAVEITQADTVIAAVGHHYGSAQVTKPPTALEEGIRTLSCSCGASITETIEKLTPTIRLNVSSLILKKKQSFTIKVSGLESGDKVSSWKSSNSRVAAVSKSGKVTGKKAGKAVITVKLASGLSRKISVRVQNGTVITKKISLDVRKITLKRNKSYRLTVTLTPITSQQKVTYATSNKKVATVNAKGKIVAKRKGTAVITVRSGTKKITCRVTVR